MLIFLCFRETKIMVQMSPDTLTPSELTVEKEDGQGSPKSESPRVLTALQFTLSPTTTSYYGYEKYIEDGLICLKHKIRNIEKKKVPLFCLGRKIMNRIQMEWVVLLYSENLMCFNPVRVCFLTAETGKLQ